MELSSFKSSSAGASTGFRRVATIVSSRISQTGDGVTISICGVSIRKDLADFKSLDNMKYEKRIVRVGFFDVCYEVMYVWWGCGRRIIF
jgi:hypothetical protein